MTDQEVLERLEGARAVLADIKRSGAEFTAELCGSWIWLVFPDKPDQEIRDQLKAGGFRWHRVKGKWFFPGVNCRGANVAMIKIRAKYGSESIDD